MITPQQSMTPKQQQQQQQQICSPKPPIIIKTNMNPMMPMRCYPNGLMTPSPQMVDSNNNYYMPYPPSAMSPYPLHHPLPPQPHHQIQPQQAHQQPQQQHQHHQPYPSYNLPMYTKTHPISVSGFLLLFRLFLSRYESILTANTDAKINIVFWLRVCDE